MKQVRKFSQNKIFMMLFFAIISFIFLSVFSMATSFLYEGKYVGWDSDIFLCLGKFADEGMVPYKDFFDHKGPFIIFIEWLGYAIGGKIGVFLLQIIFLTTALVGIYNIAKLYFGEKKSFALTLVSLFILNMYYDNGNLTEEFCLPFIVWSMYMTLKTVKEDIGMRWKGVHIDYLLYGITFMVGAMTRLTNSLPVTVLVFFGVIITISRKQWRDLIRKLLWFVIGNLIIFVPTLIYFIKVDALDEMLYATFIYNFKHGFERNALTTSELLNIVALVLPLAIVFVPSLCAYLKNRKHQKGIEAIVAIQSGVAIIMALISRPYAHYFMVWLPTIMVGVMLILKYMETIKLSKKAFLEKKVIFGVGMLVAICVVSLAKLVTTGIDIYATLNSSICQVFDDEAQEIVAKIPEEDRNQVIAYNVKSRFYLVTDILPCYKNFALQGIHTVMDDVEKEEFEKDLAGMEAKYIITGISDGTYSQFIEEHYDLEKTTRLFRVYVRK